MPRYVILEHDHPTLHYDLMLEAGDVLRTWRLSAPPTDSQRVEAEPSFDHRLHYLDYEGPVSGGRGQVRRWDAGQFEWELDEPGRVVILLRSKQLCGRAILERTESGSWTLCISVVNPP
jgi:hypothetical protein